MRVGNDKIVTSVVNCLFYFMSAGYLLFKDFCESIADEPIPQIKFYEEVSSVSKIGLNVVVS